MTKPQNCPVCGGEARVWSWGRHVSCENLDCGLYGPTAKTEQEAIEIWNRLRLEKE